MKFHDYQTGWKIIDDISKKANITLSEQQLVKAMREYMEANDHDPASRNNTRRLLEERYWYLHRRPYFNLYPSIEEKLIEARIEDLELAGLTAPCGALEIRTTHGAIFICDTATIWKGYGTEQTPDKWRMEYIYQPAGYTMDKTSPFMSATMILKGTFRDEINRLEATWKKYATDKELDYDPDFTIAKQVTRTVLGCCLLGRSSPIVTPVLLNKDREKHGDTMTPAEAAEYAERAKRRTGRVGWDVGRDLEGDKRAAHYRNGCFAKYYVGREHELYPQEATERIVPIIKWRAGAIVNKDNGIKVPTGYRDKTKATP